MELKSQKLISAKNLQLIFPMNKDFEVHSLDPSSYHGSSFEHELLYWVVFVWIIEKESFDFYIHNSACFVTRALNESISGNAIYTTEMPCLEVLLWAGMFLWFWV